jgi:hypothetical protein
LSGDVFVRFRALHNIAHNCFVETPTKVSKTELTHAGKTKSLADDVEEEK